MEETEVWLQLLQSLRQKLSLRKDDWQFELQFPITIASDPGTFAILRTVYVMEVTAKDIRYMSCPLRLDFSKELARHWSGKQSASIRTTKRGIGGGNVDIYGYSIAFHPDGRYLAFWDNSRISETVIAIFELSRAPVSSTLLRFRSLLGALAGGVRPCAFHPRLPVISFASHEIVVWNFLSCKSKNYIC